MIRLTVALLLLVSSCNGFDGSPLVDLTDEEVTQLCEEEMGDMFGELVECGEHDVDMGTLEHCEQVITAIADDCTVTAGEWRDCNQAVLDDPCYIVQQPSVTPAECEEFDACRVIE